MQNPNSTWSYGSKSGHLLNGKFTRLQNYRWTQKIVNCNETFITHGVCMHIGTIENGFSVAKFTALVNGAYIINVTFLHVSDQAIGDGIEINENDTIDFLLDYNHMTNVEKKSAENSVNNATIKKLLVFSDNQLSNSCLYLSAIQTGLAYARIWHLVDARQRILGRLATKIATTLTGKHKPIYDPASDCGDYVVVINAKEIMVTGKKEEQKVYRSHSGYPGAVSGMLPKNRLRDVRLERLKIFPDENHPYEANIIKNYDHIFLNNLPVDNKPKKMSPEKRKELKEKIKKSDVNNVKGKKKKGVKANQNHIIEDMNNNVSINSNLIEKTIKNPQSTAALRTLYQY
ncbi:9275_t:CDS:2 [Diversispora eburnea]|uniref:9275_t:CDS:1 n=1 Tax=Diversispora eburnea TaxID=1213867 RepID=A0A9N8VEJ1_9GLOM|nr:9275_t:CDS:2 [Diversispora eburnea]